MEQISFRLSPSCQVFFLFPPQDTGFVSRRGFAVFFRLIRLSVLLSLSELKEKRIWLGMIPTRASLRLKLSFLSLDRSTKLWDCARDRRRSKTIVYVQYWRCTDRPCHAAHKQCTPFQHRSSTARIKHSIAMDRCRRAMQGNQSAEIFADYHLQCMCLRTW